MSGSGKWAQPDVPHKGWGCFDVEDLGEPSAICEMCEEQEIRYVHHMVHPSYSPTLAVGCICAEHMEGDHVAPRRRERKLKNKARRRGKWISDAAWRISALGNPYKNVNGYNVALYCNYDGWRYRIKTMGGAWFAQKGYPTLESAKGAAFDALIAVEQMR